MHRTNGRLIDFRFSPARENDHFSAATWRHNLHGVYYALVVKIMNIVLLSRYLVFNRNQCQIQESSPFICILFITITDQLTTNGDHIHCIDFLGE